MKSIQTDDLLSLKLMIGFYIFKSVGAEADWLVGNFWRKVRDKPTKSDK